MDRIRELSASVPLALLACLAGAPVARAAADVGVGVGVGGAAPSVEAVPAAATDAGAAPSDPGSSAAVVGGASAPAGAATGAEASDVGPGLFAQSQTAAAAATPDAAGLEAAPPFKLGGYVRGDVFAGKLPGMARGTIKAGYGELALVARTAKSPYGDGFAETRVRYGLQGDDRRVFVDVREAYVNTYLGPVDLRLGQQIVVWGRADAFNPTNNLTPTDFRVRSPLEDDVRIGNVGARMFVRHAPFRLEAVWMPLYLPTELPPVVLPTYVAFGAPVFPSPDSMNGLVAGRLHVELPSFEASVSYLRGYALLPGLTLTGLTLTGSADPPPSILVSRTAYQQQVVGADFSTALGDVLTLRGEAAYRRPGGAQEPGSVARPDVQYVVGVDHSFGALSVIVQYLGRYVFDWQKQNGPAMPIDPSVLPMLTMADSGFVTGIVNAELAKTNQILFSQTARVQHVATVRFEYLAAHDTLSLSSLCMLNFTTREWLLTPRIGYRVSDALTAYVGAQIFKGPNDTLFGLIDEELSAGYVELRVAF